MGKFQQDAAKLLELVGGKENVAAITHCVTRMRFVLNDPSIADVAKIEKLPSVKGTFTQAGQFQVIIGNQVADFYDDFVAVSGISGISKAELKSQAKQNQTFLQRLMSDLAEIFAPLIPAIITGGLILGFRNVIDSMYILENGTKTICDVFPFWATVDNFLWLLGEAIFHMLPVGICWSVAKKKGTTEILGIILGLTLVSGQLLNAYAVASATEETWAAYTWDFGFAQVHKIGYQAQVIPAILAAFALVYLEKFFKKIVPQVLQMILVPFCSLLLAVMAAHFILGPIGWFLGDIVAKVVLAGITGPVKALFGAIFGFVYAPLVITGLHHMTNAIDMQLIQATGGTMLWPMIALSNIAQGSAVLGMIRLQKKNAARQEVNIPACISCYLGVTEPAIFGVNMKYNFPFLCGMTGSAIAGCLSVLMGCTANAIGVGGLPGILSMQAPSWLKYAFCMLLAVVIPFVLTMIIGKRKGTDVEAEREALEEAAEAEAAAAAEEVKAANAGKPVDLVAFLSGTTVNIENVPDQVFASKALGEGMAIDPTDDCLVAPADGTVSVTMDESNHAVGLTLDNGVEILLHIGLDTVGMNGDGFECFVKMGEHVKAGQKLIKFDPAKIRAAGHPLVTMLVITDDGGMSDFRFTEGTSVAAGRDTIAEIR
ncbi:MAG: PTS system trehalose-specific EIIBC component [Lachnospiraceae bacterium]|nr:PTS system trehalose-specific EIIBC component [Lachnospiraceae bacterium]